MQKLKMRPGLLAVEKLTKAPKKEVDSFFVTPQESSSVGVVVYAADDVSELLGKKIYFGTKREEMNVLGKDLLFMEKTNVYAEVEDTDPELKP